MKRFAVLCIYLIWLSNSLMAQTITTFQYWFDGNYATRVNTNTSSTDKLDLQTNISVSNLSYGLHDITMRFQDSQGKWSVPIREFLYYNNTKITEIEYWIDNDYANKTTETYVGEDEINFLQMVNISDLDDSMHTFHFRAKDNNGKWSVTTSSYFMNKSHLVAYEYWYDDAIDDAVYVAIEPTFLLEINESFNSSSLPNGTHTMHFRALNNFNKWSSVVSTEFIKNIYGITVLVHGFQPTGGGIGGVLFSPTEDFEKMGSEIIKRAGGGIMFKNNSQTGQLEIVKNTGDNYYPFNPSKEIVLVYDWGDLSKNGTTSQSFAGDGYLEAAADNLFASILKLKNPLGTQTLSLEQFLQKPKHIIGHSRGTILNLQLAHRLLNYFPNINIEQMTFLDPHPATVFGDMTGLYGGISYIPSNLPGVFGVAKNCGLLGCLDATTGQLYLPDNILKADNYFRKDGQYEGLTSVASYGSFDGLPIPLLGKFNRELDNATLSNYTLLGGAHSNVHKWYRATIDTNIDVTGDEIKGTDLWFGNGIGAPMGANNFMYKESRTSTGFAYSRIGGRYNFLPLINPDYKLKLEKLNKALAEREGVSSTNPNGIAPRNVFNGDFHYKNSAGWIKNGGTDEDLISISDEKAIINISMNLGVQYLGESYLKHSLMYFGGTADNNNYLQFDIKKHNSTNTGQCIIKFYNTAGQEIERSSIDLSYIDNTWKTVFIPIPDILKPSSITAFNGEVGTFGIFGSGLISSPFEVDNIKLNSCIPTSSNLSINNVIGILDNVKIYPNPTDNILFIDTLDKQIQKIELFDLQGRLLKTINENKEKYQIDISNLSSATYLIKLSTEKGSQTVKVVKK